MIPAAAHVHSVIPTISPATLQTAVIGLGYLDQVTANGTAPLNFRTFDALPPGLSLQSSGVIQGTPLPTALRSVTINVEVFNADGSATAQVTIPVRPAIGPTLTSTTLPPASIGTLYSEKIARTGDGRIDFTSASPLPPGLDLDLDGTIHGVPTATTSSAFDVTVQAVSFHGFGRATAVFTIPIANPLRAPVFTSGSPMAGVVGAPYSFAPSATGEPAPTYSISSGRLPSGLQIDSVSGLISGTPLEALTARFSVSATNAAGSAAAELSITITAAATTPPTTGATPPATLTPTPGSSGVGGTAAGVAGEGSSRGTRGTELAETGLSVLGVVGGAAAAALLLAALGGLLLAASARRSARRGA
ncbi:putative Ig domain-containing protein [Subtercola boreus]|nr:putative Ig domain-containing protein [Subtercola boreus]